MKPKKPFHPLYFQASLAAGGITLMCFNYLQFAIPHGGGLITLSDISWNTLTGGQWALYFPLVAIMFSFIIVSLLLTVVYLKDLISWVAAKEEYEEFINNPHKNVGIFAVISSLAMTLNVFWAPIGFFIPQVSSNLQRYMLPSLIFFGILWFFLIKLEIKVVKNWLTESVDVRKFNFIWLLDVFAFALVSLAGSGVASLSSNSEIAAIATFASIFTISVGFVIFLAKMGYLIYLQLQSEKLPDKPVLPAYFLVIPITCLFGISLFRIAMYMQTYLSINMSGLSFFIINFSYVITISWGVFTFYLLSNYFKNEFISSDFAFTQWGIV